MRVAALYDIHGNLPALDAVLADSRFAGVDRVVVGGDVFPGPMGAEALARLRALDRPVDFIMGNGDREVIAVRGGHAPGVPAAFHDVIRFGAAQLDEPSAAFVAGWPATLALDVDGVGRVFFCHATPRNDVEIFTRETAEAKLAPIFGGLDAAMAVCGHTHMAFDRMAGRVRVANAGSVGMPFGEPGAYWLRIGPDVEWCRTAYDLDAAAARVRATTYPQRDAFADTSVLRPPSEADMLRAFAPAELT